VFVIQFLNNLSISVSKERTDRQYICALKSLQGDFGGIVICCLREYYSHHNNCVHTNIYTTIALATYQSLIHYRISGTMVRVAVHR